MVQIANKPTLTRGAVSSLQNYSPVSMGGSNFEIQSYCGGEEERVLEESQ
jgi:hypothetical protein